MNKIIKFANVKFEDTPWQQYCFLTDIPLLQIGDNVVVETAKGIKIGRFSGYVTKFPEDHIHQAKWIVQKVDMVEHKMRVRATVDIQKLLKKQQLESKLNGLLEQVREVQQEMAGLSDSRKCCFDDIPNF